MTKMTITEALAEIKLINDKVNKKRGIVMDNLVRAKHIPDSLITKGGTPAVIASEVQSIIDLEARLSKIRCAIMAANLANTAECNGITDTLYGWLVWKREVARNRASFYEQIYSQTKRKIDQAVTQVQVYKNDAGTPLVVEWETALPYMEYATKHNDVTETLNKLDGILSLKNATIMIEV